MKRFVAALGLCAVLAPGHLLAQTAQTQTDPLSWLGRIASAGQRLNYSGTFIYQAGSNFETSRIAHVVDASGEHERLEVLDGSPREVIRSNNEVRCILPDQKTVIIDRTGGRRSFPARLPVSFTGLAENYRISLGAAGRVAGLDAQLVLLEPKDNLRYGHMLWAEVNSGLLMKARMVDESGAVIEQFTFTDVKIGGAAGEEALQRRHADKTQWRVVTANGEEIRPEESAWTLTAALPGYALKSVMRRPLGVDQGEILHYVFSDGLASISVFIEPMGPNGEKEGFAPFANGPINIYRKMLNGYLITALGEVPFEAIKRLGDGVEPGGG